MAVCGGLLPVDCTRRTVYHCPADTEQPGAHRRFCQSIHDRNDDRSRGQHHSRPGFYLHPWPGSGRCCDCYGAWQYLRRYFLCDFYNKEMPLSLRRFPETESDRRGSPRRPCDRHSGLCHQLHAEHRRDADEPLFTAAWNR